MDLELVNLGLVSVGPFVVIGGLWKVASWSVNKHADELTTARLGRMQVRAAEAERGVFQLGKEEVRSR